MFIIMVLGTIFCILFCYIVRGTFVLDHSAAIKECRDHGGLASYKHFIRNERINFMEGLSIDEGESAWISGHLEYSEFVSWYGCYVTDKSNLLKFMLEEDNIYNCLEKCSKLSDILYIGIRNKNCYCLTPYQITHFTAQPDNECNMELISPYVVVYNGNITQQPSGQENINVYTIINQKVLHLDPPIPESHNQCVYTQSDGRTSTQSCHSLTDGFICINGAYKTLSKKCDKFYPGHRLPFCVVSQSASWLTSLEECISLFGKPIHYPYSSVTVQLPHGKYWTGIFRSFKLRDENNNTGQNVCIAVRKVNSKLVLDPASCSTEFGYVCENSISKRTSNKTYRTATTQDKRSSVPIITSQSVVRAISVVTEMKPAPRGRHLTTLPYLTTPTLTNNPDSFKGLNVVAIVVGLLVAISILITVATVLLVKRNRNKTQHQKNEHAIYDEPQFSADDARLGQASEENISQFTRRERQAAAKDDTMVFSLTKHYEPLGTTYYNSNTRASAYYEALDV